MWVDPSSAQHGTPIKTSTTATTSTTTATGGKTENMDLSHTKRIKINNKNSRDLGIRFGDSKSSVHPAKKILKN